ncbi:MAG TPA: hypothetical protein PKI03_33180, partial [Pseudomonadota bacterium]|nr:hypothetical protein [Pseudomonadota bacterium]
MLKLAGLLLHFADAKLLSDAQAGFGFGDALAVLLGLDAGLPFAAIGFLSAAASLGLLRGFFCDALRFDLLQLGQGEKDAVLALGSHRRGLLPGSYCSRCA